jgi:photosystem II stability/assembly factor-like uncharacterized protein
MKTLLNVVAFITLLTGADVAFAQTWTPVSPAISGCGPVASSADGRKLVVCSLQDAQVYLSTDYGISWTQYAAPFDPNGEVHSVASSADGTKVVVENDHAYSSTFFTSTNSGTSWTQSTNASSSQCFVACSADGIKLVAVSLYGEIHTSNDSGITWTLATNAPNAEWVSVTSSADGTKLAAAAWHGIYTSTNSGATWLSNNAPIRPEAWTAVASSADGTKLVATIPNDAIYTSTNSGATWISNDVPKLFWTAAASSADGTKLVAAAHFNFIYTSTNSGVTWTGTDMGTNTVFYRGSIASSADGARLVAVDTHIGSYRNPNGNIYTLQTTPAPVLNIASVSNGLKLSWLVPSINFVLQQNSDLSTTNWVTLANMPTLNLTNLQNEVFLPPPASNSFFRLATP